MTDKGTNSVRLCRQTRRHLRARTYRPGLTCALMHQEMLDSILNIYFLGLLGAPAEDFVPEYSLVYVVTQTDDWRYVEEHLRIFSVAQPRARYRQAACQSPEEQAAAELAQAGAGAGAVGEARRAAERKRSTEVGLVIRPPQPRTTPRRAIPGVPTPAGPLPTLRRCWGCSGKSIPWRRPQPGPPPRS